MDKKNTFRRQREIVDLLLKEGLINQAAIEKAREETKRTGLTMERALEKLGYLTSEDIIKVRAQALGLPTMDLNDYVIDAELIKLIPENIARKFKAVPLFKIGNSISIGMVDPQDIVALDQIRKACQIETIEPILVSEKGIEKVFDSHYGASFASSGSMDKIAESITQRKGAPNSKKGFMEVAEDAPVVTLVNTLIAQAVQDKASDIHIEPEDENVRVRCRIDGILHEISVFPKELQSPIISRIKVLSHLDIAESRTPQDGRLRLKLEGKDLDIRISTFPTVHGENVVMRLLDKSSVLLGLKEVGFLEKDNEVFEKLIRRPNGIILVTGPTGSGKTTTLYAALSTISTMQKNVITIEDPVEYELPLIRQTQVMPKAGITFANGLRSILRQDPDIIMVGEIRDKETADIATQAALTGHLVFSTLHTNDATSALTRLLDMGVEPFLISSSVIGIAAQRLVRVICTRCKEKYEPTGDILKDLNIQEAAEFYRGKGCNSCKGTGFKGRTGIFEMLVVDEEIKRLIDAKSSSDEIKRKARESGMRILREDGLTKIKKGITTPEEVLRVTEVG